jgi:hypothetical protein
MAFGQMRRVQSDHAQGGEMNPATLDQLDPLPPLGLPVHKVPAAIEEWEQIPGERIGLERNTVTGKHRNIDPGPMIEWPFG